MSRIEQLPDGTYVRTLSNVERAIIKKLYEEIHDREVADVEVDVIVKALSDNVTALANTLSNYLPASHQGKGGAVHAEASSNEAGFMSRAEHVKLSKFGEASAYVLKTDYASLKASLEDHLLEGTHAPVSDLKSRSMTPDYKMLIDNALVRKTGGTLTGRFTFTERENGFRWDAKGNPGSDGARIEFVDNDTGPSEEDSTLYIEVYNDGNVASGPDRVVIGTVTENTHPASEVRLRTIKKDGTVNGGKIVLETDVVEAPAIHAKSIMNAGALGIYGMNIDHILIIGCGLDGVRATGTGVWINGTKYETISRGLNVIALNRASRAMVLHKGYDTHSSAGSATTPSDAIDALTNDLNLLDHNHVVFIWAYDQPSFENRMSSAGDVTQLQIDNAIAALQRLGASDIVRNMPYRSSYAMVGIPTIGKGNALEQIGYPDAVELSTLLVEGTPLGLSFG
ncbi:hypothetical protein D3C85_908920 [compost metagenome]